MHPKACSLRVASGGPTVELGNCSNTGHLYYRLTNIKQMVARHGYAIKLLRIRNTISN